MCIYNTTVYHGFFFSILFFFFTFKKIGATQAYRWNCKTDVASWFIDLSVIQGIPIYQHFYPQPIFESITQDLWFDSFEEIQSFDQDIFIPPQGWRCPN